ncbi:MAG TPA: sigma-54 dependent transcriptional regulator [Syntrophorhabdales bacterium]|nr:sigma-54 dependent transcriptional regulator [Syntrophorhabdales bacterium]
MARRIQMFLLDVNPANNLGASLEKILKSSPSFSVELRKTVLHDESMLRDLDLATTIARFKPDIICIVLSSEHLSHFDALAGLIRSTLSDQRIMVVVEGGDPERLAEVLKLGTVDFITAPLRAFDVLPRLVRLLEAPLTNESLARRMKEKLGLKRLVGESPVFLAEINKIPVVANRDATVLISGETGTGKELCARALHYLSRRSGRAFIAVNCGAVPTELLENELFGHAKGAFTGASSTQDGLIREADEGTLFLDEVDCLPLPAQVKLLRFLQDKEYKMLGSNKVCRADARIIAATGIDLENAARDGKFRLDLFYRLNVVPLALPPLRERRDDIPILARHFLEKYAFEFQKNVFDFSPEAMRILLLHSWLGNVRELENVVERAVIFARQKNIQYEEIVLSQSEPLPERAPSFKRAKAIAVEQFEKKYIRELLVASRGNISLAAKAAQKNRRAFWELIRRHRIDARSFRTTSA